MPVSVPDPALFPAPFPVIRAESPAPEAPLHLVVETPSMTLRNARTIWEAGQAFLDGEDKIIDLAAVREVDSSAIAVLLEWQRENQNKAQNQRQGRLQILSPPDSLTALAALYDLDGIIRF